MLIPVILLLLQIASAALPPADFVPEENPDLVQYHSRNAPPRRPSPSRLDKRQLQPYQIMNTTTPVNFWFDKGPTYYDVVQRKFADCWLAAAMSAVVAASPDWMSHLFFYANGEPVSGSENPSMTDVQVVLWHPITRQPRFFHANAFNQSNTEDHPGQRWWPSAILQSIMRFGAEAPIGGIIGQNATFDEGGGNAATALTVLTGYPVVAKLNTTYNGDEDKLYQDLSMAYKYKTPIVISTIGNDSANNTFSDGSALHGTHAYAVIWTIPDLNGTRGALLCNPWGKQKVVEVTISDIYKHMHRVVHLEQFRTLDWEAAVGEATQEKEAARRSVGGEADASYIAAGGKAAGRQSGREADWEGASKRRRHRAWTG